MGFFSRETKESAKMPVPKPPAPPSMEPVKKQDNIPVPPKRETHMERAVEVEGSDASPPLFIKVDKYGEVVKNVQRLKSFALGLRDALDALADIEKELSTGLTIANRALDNFNSTISILDSKLLRVAATGIDKTDVNIPDELDDYIKNVYEQMNKLKHELKTISQER